MDPRVALCASRIINSVNEEFNHLSNTLKETNDPFNEEGQHELTKKNTEIGKLKILFNEGD